MSSVLMTGFPGFLGSALLPRALKRREGASAICLVQPQHLATAPGRLTGWTLEASTGVAPLSVIAASGQAVAQALPRNSLVVVSVQLLLSDGPWLRSAPVCLGAGALAPAANHTRAA